MLQKSDLYLIWKYFRTPSEVGAAACRRCPAAFCSRHHHALYLCQMNVQLLGCEEGRKESREDVEKREGVAAKFCPETLGAAGFI